MAAYFEATEMASDLVWRALAPAFPGKLTAGSFVSVCSTSLALTHPDSGQPALLVEPQPGGWGAGAGHDGQNALVSVGDGETYVIPVEVAEQRYGIRVERFGLDVVPGAGAGRYRGGRGIVREYRILSDDAQLTVAWGRHQIPPWVLPAFSRGHLITSRLWTRTGKPASRSPSARGSPCARVT